MIVKSKNKSFNEQESHVWIKYDGDWLRFTHKNILDAKKIAKNNSHETPTFLQRIKYFLTRK